MQWMCGTFLQISGMIAPETCALPHLHTKFAFADIILHAEVADLTPATAKKVEDKWSTMVLEMNRCIANWQKSGQGEDGINDAEMKWIRSLAVLRIVLRLH